MREVIVEQATGKVVTDNIDPDYFVDGDEFFRLWDYGTSTHLSKTTKV